MTTIEDIELKINVISKRNEKLNNEYKTKREKSIKDYNEFYKNAPSYFSIGIILVAIGFTIGFLITV